MYIVFNHTIYFGIAAVKPYIQMSPYHQFTQPIITPNRPWPLSLILLLTPLTTFIII